MTNLSARQEMNLNLVSSADQRWRDGRRHLEAVVRQEVKERGQHLLDARDDATLIAHESGIPKTKIALLGLHTKNTKSVLEAIAHAVARKQALAASHFSRGEGDGELVITLTDAALADACTTHAWSVGEAKDAGVDTASFRVVDPANGGAPVLVAVTPSFVPEQGKPNPVVAWGRAHAEEALAWWKETAA